VTVTDISRTPLADLDDAGLRLRLRTLRSQLSNVKHEIARRERLARDKANEAADEAGPGSLAKARRLVENLTKTQNRLAQFGARDTEPDAQRQLCLRRALICGVPYIPQTPGEWQLYSADAFDEDEPGYLSPEQIEAAGKSLTEAAKAADAEIRRLPLADRKRLYREVDLWRVQIIDTWDW
jgi:hypothetical protein